MRARALAAALLLAAGAAPAENPSAGETLALVGGTVYTAPAEAPLREAVVLVENGTIAAVGSRKRVAIPKSARVVDCSGLTITAGFWNSHVHFFERKWSNAAGIPAAELERQLQESVTRYGFTSVFDLGSPGENTRRLRDRIESGEVGGPRIRSTGEALVAPNAVPPPGILAVLGIMSFPAPEVVDAAQAAAAAKQLLADGADGIKVHLQSPPPPSPPIPEAAIAAAAAEAHKAGKPVFVHPNTLGDVLAALRAGADVLAHTTPRSAPWDEATITAMKEAKVAVTPTLSAWRQILRHDRLSAAEAMTKAGLGQLRAWQRAGGTVLFGTDLGAVDPDPTEEYALMAEAGMGLPQILAALTTAPSERFGAPRLGRVAPGLQADLVVLKGDPAKDIRALAAVVYTMRAGKIVYRAGA